MKRLAAEIATATVTAGAVRLWWLGGSGFAFKTADGRVLLLDPYLSDSVERLHSFKRMCPPPLLPEEAHCTEILCTHEHTDHLDPDTLAVIARLNPRCAFAGPASCVAGFRQLGIPPDRITELPLAGQASFAGITVHTIPSDHGDLSPDAVTPLLDFGGVRILHSGDTSWCPARIRPLLTLRTDILLPCINGNFGNMNHIDAARMTQQVKPRIVIPHHFWLFVEHGGDPAGFLHACRYLCPEVEVKILRPGEGLEQQAV